MTGLVVFVFGTVQRVGYRRWAKRRASARNLDGWVRNYGDRVQMSILGADEDVSTFLLECLTGPPKAKVTRVSFRPSRKTPPPGFSIRQTAFSTVVPYTEGTVPGPVATAR